MQYYDEMKNHEPTHKDSNEVNGDTSRLKRQWVKGHTTKKGEEYENECCHWGSNIRITIYTKGCFYWKISIFCYIDQ